jgi:hypothetical protein
VRLENPSLAARITNAVGTPVGKLLNALPPGASGAINTVVAKAMKKSLDVAVNGLSRSGGKPPANRSLRTAVGATGAAGGFFGLPALALELPVTTTLMLRSIADIARSEGEDLSQPEPRLACMEVFALGGGGSPKATESTYYAVRTVLARAVSEAAKYIAERGIAEEGAPILIRLISAIAARFGIVVSEKVAAAAVPVVGALGGATVNLIFMNHFQDMAQGHFAIRRLERIYGAEVVRGEYEAIRMALPKS